MTYSVIKNGDFEDFQDDVNTALAGGATLVGGVGQTVDGQFIQAVTNP